MRVEVDPGQRDPDDGELGEPVRERGRLDQERRALDDVLQRQLDHRAEAALEVDDPGAVRERGRVALAVGDAAGELVGEVERDPEAELEREVRPPAREPAGDGCGAGGHRTSDCTPVPVGTIPQTSGIRTRRIVVVEERVVEVRRHREQDRSGRGARSSRRTRRRRRRRWAPAPQVGDAAARDRGGVGVQVRGRAEDGEEERRHHLRRDEQGHDRARLQDRRQEERRHRLPARRGRSRSPSRRPAATRISARCRATRRPG